MPTPSIPQLEPGEEVLCLASYEYVFFLTARWYAEEHAPATDPETSFAYFKNNQPISDLTASKLLLFPFYFATANGHTEALVACMGNFYAHEEGPIPHPLLNALFGKEAHPTRGFPNLVPRMRGDTGRYGLTMTHDFASWDELEAAILARSVNQAGAPLTFGEVRIQADPNSHEGETELHQALKKSAQIIRVIDRSFVDHSLGEFSSLSRLYRSFRHYLEFEPDQPMRPEFVRNDRKVYAPSTEVYTPVSELAASFSPAY